MPFKLDISCDIIVETTDIYLCNVLFMIKASLSFFSFRYTGSINVPDFLLKLRETYTCL